MAARSRIMTDLRRRTWPDWLGPPCADTEFPSYTPAERRVDAVVHMVGLALALAASANFRALVLALTWRRFNTAGASRACRSA